MTEMNKFYNDKVKSDYGIIYVPEIGKTPIFWHKPLICIALIQTQLFWILSNPKNIVFPAGITCAAQDADGQWYRAMIIDEPTKARMVTVTLVDVGRKINISFDNIRTLHGKFMTGTAQVSSSIFLCLIRAKLLSVSSWVNTSYLK